MVIHVELTFFNDRIRQTIDFISEAARAFFYANCIVIAFQKRSWEVNIVKANSCIFPTLSSIGIFGDKHEFIFLEDEGAEKDTHDEQREYAVHFHPAHIGSFSLFVYLKFIIHGFISC